MKSILIILGHYLPGYKDGGPVTSIRNLTDRLGEEYAFHILTTDRDQGDNEPYPDIKANQWNIVGKAKVWYAAEERITSDLIEDKAKNKDIIYLCGCFNDYARQTLKLKKQEKIVGKIIIASMGLFSPGAYSIKKTKKQIYMLVLKITGLLKQVEWSASNEQEVADIKRVVGKKAICNIAEDLPQVFERKYEKTASDSGKLRIISLARISPEKNLKYAIEILQNVHGNVVFDIYGNVGNSEYFEECMKEMKQLPQNISAKYRGAANPNDVLKIFSEYDVFLFPTLGENYGHSIIESMGAGCVPIISDATPWNDLDDKDAGNVISLQDKKQFVNVIEKYVDMTSNELKELSDQSYQYAVTRDITNAVNGYRKMFDRE